jgi:hypothetical protein
VMRIPAQSLRHFAMQQGANDNIYTQNRWKNRRLRKLHNEKLYNFYISPNIITVIKSIGREWVGHLARTGEDKSAHNFMVE